MTVSKTRKVAKSADDLISTGSPVSVSPLPDPKTRFRAVMRQAAAARAAGDKTGAKASKIDAELETAPMAVETAKSKAKSATTKTAATKNARRTRKAEALQPKMAGARRAAAKTRSKPGQASPSHLVQGDTMAACYRSGAALVEGLQTSGALWGEFAKAHFDRGVEAAFALVTAKSMHEMMDIQNGWTASSIDAALAQGLRLSDVAVDTTRKAADPMAEGVDGTVGETKDRISA